MADFVVDHHGAVACEIAAGFHPVADAAVPPVEVDDDVIPHTAAVFGAASGVERLHVFRFGKHHGEVACVAVAFDEGGSGTRPAARIVEHAVHGVGETVQSAHIAFAGNAVGVLRNGFAAVVRRFVRFGLDRRRLFIADRGGERFDLPLCLIR